ncbi:MAG: YjbH domain-containing protein [Longimicrobiaceae bacterium]
MRVTRSVRSFLCTVALCIGANGIAAQVPAAASLPPVAADSTITPIPPDQPDLAVRAAASMTRRGFANVAAVLDGQRLFVAFENTLYRDERRALRQAAELVWPELDAGQELVLVATDRAIPLVALRYATPGGMDSSTLTRGSAVPSPQPTASLDVSDLPPALLHAPVARPSFGRFDVAVHPWLEAVFGDGDNPVASRTGLAPELRVALRHGLSVSAQTLITLQDDVPTGESRVRPALVTLNQTVRLPRNVFVSATLGTFTPDRYGLDLEGRAYSLDGRWSVGAEIGRTGGVAYGREGWTRTPMQSRTLLADAAWWSPRYDVRVQAMAGTFLDTERGVRLELVRRFGEVEIGWFVTRSEAGGTGGAVLQVPLLPARYAALGPARLRAADAFHWEYRYRDFVPVGRRYRTGNRLEDLVGRFHPDRVGSAYATRTAESAAAESTDPPLGPSLTGTTGLVTVPTATMPPDGTVTVGLNYVDRRYHDITKVPLPGHPALIQFVSIGWLPFLEVGLRLTRAWGQSQQALGDRMVSLRLRLVEEGSRTPAVVVGIHDIVGTRIAHAEYVTASKVVRPVPILGTVGLHLGYGGDWSSLRVQGRQFTGVFGGVSITPVTWTTLLVEHDSDRLNAAVRLRLWRLSLLAAVHKLDRFSGGISYVHPLKGR